jgi:hypothetical protein
VRNTVLSTIWSNLKPCSSALYLLLPPFEFASSHKRAGLSQMKSVRMPVVSHRPHGDSAGKSSTALRVQDSLAPAAPIARQFDRKQRTIIRSALRLDFQPPSGRSGPEAPCGAAFFQVLSDAESASVNNAESRLDDSWPPSRAVTDHNCFPPPQPCSPWPSPRTSDQSD